MGKTKTDEVAEPLLAIDRKARALFTPYESRRTIKALKWFGQAGDQLQLRSLCGGVLALGLLRRDPRLVGAAVRMFVSHEAATWAKRRVKNRIDRWRPRDASNAHEVKPRKGHSKASALNSFPSGHSAGSMAVACAFAARYPEYRTPALAAGASVCLVQVPTCSHYPSDVVVGAALGALTDAVVGFVWRGLRAAVVR
jgi:undecaprenyl-diphosphatase